MRKYNIHPKDLRFDTIDVGGNWHSRPVGVRVTHIPSGKCFESVESRSQHLNRNHCLNQQVIATENYIKSHTMGGFYTQRQ